MEKLCSIEGCGRKVLSHGYCRTHRERLRTGVPLDKPIRARQNQRPICSVETCEKTSWSKGFCTTHLYRWRRGLDLDAPLQQHNKGLACSVEGCETPAKACGLCATHYARVLTKGEPGSAEIDRGKPRGVPCEVPDCVRVSDALGLCRMHYERLRKHGDVGGPHSEKRSAGEGHIDGAGYRIIWVNGKTMLEHRYVMEQKLGRKLFPHEKVHHRNGIKLDNRASNLELWIKGHPAGGRVEDLVKFVASFYPVEAVRELTKITTLPFTLTFHGTTAPRCNDCGCYHVVPLEDDNVGPVELKEEGASYDCEETL